MITNEQIRDIIHYTENHDKTMATISIYIQEIMQLDEFSPDVVVNYLNQLGLKNMTSENEITKKVENCLNFAEDLTEFIVAIGRPAQKGKDCHIDFTFLDATESFEYFKECEIDDITKRNIFYFSVPDMVLGKLISASDGTEGEDVYGNVIEAIPGRNFKIQHNKYVRVDKDEVTFIADMYGIINIKDNSIDVLPVTMISSDAMTGYITFFPNIMGKEELKLEHILGALRKGGILKGEDKEIIIKYLKECNDRQEILWNRAVAFGKLPENGKDADIVLYFSTEKKHGKIYESGSMDFKEKNRVINIAKDSLLAEKHPAIPGVPGYKVNGQTLTAPSVKDKNLILGQNVVLSEDGLKYYAGVDGHIELKNGNELHVFPVYKIRGDVDLETGNIRFLGDVEISGVVKEGFSVIAGGDIFVKGIVEDAIIESGGNVEMQKGIIGKGKGHVLAKGNIVVVFCENAHLEAEGDIIVKDELLSSKVNTLSRVILNERRGSIRGGVITAKLGIEAKSVGSESYTTTKLIVGVDFVAKKRLEQIAHNKKICEKNIEKIIMALGPSLANQKIPKLNKYPPKQRAVFREILKKKRKIEKDLKKMEKEKEKLVAELDKYRTATIRITGDVYPGAFITIANLVMPVQKHLRNVTFYINENIGQISFKNN